MSQQHAAPISDIELAIAAAQAGAAVVRAKYGTPVSHYAKSLTDFATDADIEAERVTSHEMPNSSAADFSPTLNSAQTLDRVSCRHPWRSLGLP